MLSTILRTKCNSAIIESNARSRSCARILSLSYGIGIITKKINNPNVKHDLNKFVPKFEIHIPTMFQLVEISICDNCDARCCSKSLHLGDIFLGQIIHIL